MPLAEFCRTLQHGQGSVKHDGEQEVKVRNLEHGQSALASCLLIQLMLLVRSLLAKARILLSFLCYKPNHAAWVSIGSGITGIRLRVDR